MKLFFFFVSAHSLIAMANGDQSLCDSNEDLLCVPENMPCSTDNNDEVHGGQRECCDGMGCFGFNFFKRCSRPPACLQKWYDCSSGMKCCGEDEGETVCAKTSSGALECQPRTIETDPPPPPEANNTTVDLDVTAADLRTTAIPGAPVTYDVGCVAGDPHVYNFDGLAHDCQAEGEFILVKSNKSQRQIQGRFSHFMEKFSPNNAWSVTKGIVIQDEGDTPRVQLNVPVQETSLAPNSVGPHNCPVQFFVDYVQRDLTEGSGSDKVNVDITMGGTGIEIFYTRSQFKVVVTTGWANGCFFSVCVYLPNVDETVGLLGSANKDISDDWMDRDGNTLPVPPSLQDRMGFDGYNHCTTNWCIRDATESLFFYAEQGLDFDDYSMCDLPFGNTIEEYLENASEEIVTFCNSEIMCIIDAMMGDLDTAASTNTAREKLKATCNMEGGECNFADCCAGLICAQVDGLGKECVKEAPQCMGPWGSCGDGTTECCDDLTCHENSNGDHLCMDLPECMPEWRDCGMIDCCDDLTCVENPNSPGRKRCIDLPECMPEWQDCSFGIDCCDGLTCVSDEDTGRERCENVPTCQAHQWHKCSDDLPCCEESGFSCVPNEHTGEYQCRELPSCVAEWQSCYHVDCCQDGPFPLACTEYVDGSGFAAKNCQVACKKEWNSCDINDVNSCCGDLECRNFHGQVTCLQPIQCYDNWQFCESSKPCCNDDYQCVLNGSGDNASGQCMPK